MAEGDDRPVIGPREQHDPALDPAVPRSEQRNTRHRRSGAGCSRSRTSDLVRGDQGVTAAILVAQLISGARVLPHVWSTWNCAKVQDCPMYSVASQIVDPTASAAL